MCDLVEESFIGEILGDELRKKIPKWFDKDDAGLLITALVNAELEDELAILIGYVKDEIQYNVKKVIRTALSGKGKKINIKEGSFNLLRAAVIEIEADLEAEIRETEIRISRLTKQVKTLKKESEDRKKRKEIS